MEMAISRMQQALIEEAGILMLGRITFGDFADHWQHLANESEPQPGETLSLDDMQRAYARRLDAMRKIVVSVSGNVAAWRNSETLSTINANDIGRLKRESGGDIVIYGSVSVINAPISSTSITCCYIRSYWGKAGPCLMAS